MPSKTIVSKLLPPRLPPIEEQTFFQKYDLVKIIIFYGWPIVTGILIWSHIYFETINWYLLIAGFFLARMAQLSISAGYHRLYSHRSYKAHPLLHFFYLFLGASAVQQSALKWANDHRRHHLFPDQKEDPYSITNGFFYAHMGWIVDINKKKYRKNLVSDWLNHPLVIWQHKNYNLLLFFHTITMPLIVGLIVGSPLGGLAFLGFLKGLIVQHTTFSINSIAHRWGKRPFDKKSTARENILVALLAMGEGYHNYHHFAPGDYRSGVSKWALDMSKWFIFCCSKIGLAKDLKRVSQKNFRSIINS